MHDCMRPYSNKWQWNLKSRPHHLIDGLLPAAKQLKGAVHQAFLVRAGMMLRALKARAVVLGLLYLGVIASGLVWVASILPVFAPAAELTRGIAQLLSGISALLVGIYLLVGRRIGQLEADLVTLCITNK